MERITNTPIGREYGWDTLADVNWDMLAHNVRCQRNILDNPEKFPKANFERVELMEHEGTMLLLKGPAQHLATAVGR